MESPVNRCLIQRALLVVLAMLAVVNSGLTQSLSHSVPDNNYLHEIVQKWTEKSSIENLRTADFSGSDIEVRIWAGFGLRGTSGGVLRKKANKWTVSFIDLDKYRAGGTNEIAARERLLPPCIVNSMRDRCVIETSLDPDGKPDAHSLDCASIYPSPRHEDKQELEQLWRTLEKLGIHQLPPTIERDWIMMDGHSYVIEVRIGNEYRATVTEHAQETEADEQIHKIVSAFDSVLGTQLYGGDN